MLAHQTARTSSLIEGGYCLPAIRLNNRTIELGWRTFTGAAG